MRHSLGLLLLGAGLAVMAATPSAFARGSGGGGGHFAIAIRSAPAGRAPGFNHVAPGFNHSPFHRRVFRSADRRRRDGWYNGFGGCCYALPYDYDDASDAAGPGVPPGYFMAAGYPPPPTRRLPPMGMTVEHSHGVTIYRGPPILP